MLLNSITDFRHYNEVKPLASTSVHLSWTYLIKFQTRQYPEKQQIDISFSTEGPGVIFDDVFDRVIGTIHRPHGYIRFRISHTNRTWGTDIESLLAGHLKTLLKNPRGTRAFAESYAGWLGFGTGIAAFISILAMGSQFIDKFYERHLSDYEKIGALPASIETLTKKIDFLVSSTLSGATVKHSFYFTISFFGAILISVIIGGVIGTTAGKPRPNFVLMTKKAEEKREIELRRYSNNWLYFLFSITGTLVLAVLGHFIFYRFVHHWIN